MKKLPSLMLAAIFASGVLNAQNAMDAYRYSKNDLTGTARSVSMGGAFGALGGDISGIAINPAGIGVYRNSEIVTTLNFQNTKTQTQLLGQDKIEKSKFNVGFDNLAFVTAIPIYNEVAPILNIGFSYNKLKNFDRKYETGAGGLSTSLPDYMAHRATAGNVSANNIKLKGADPNTIYNIWDTQDWLSVLGYNSYLINENSTGNGYSPSFGEKVYVANRLSARERGYVGSYDFNIGTTFADMLSFGVTLSVTDINYRLSSTYTEEFGDGGLSRGYDMENSLRTDGTGLQVKVGAILKPIQELRIGVAYHSPTWYNMTDNFYTDLHYDFSDFKGNYSLRDNNAYVSSSVQLHNGEQSAILDYKYRTPDKWVFSLAGVIGTKAIISADYELTNYGGNLKLFNNNGGDFSNNPNAVISKIFRTASTLRVGGEYRFTDRFSGRVGYAWMQSPVKPSVTKAGDSLNSIEITNDGRAITQYGLDGDANYFTYGLGYKFTPQFYVDIAFVMKNETDKFYTFDFSDQTKFKTNTFQGLLTLGYKF